LERYTEGMKFSPLTKRIAPTQEQDDLDAWEVHNLAVDRVAAGDDVILLSIGQEANEVTPPAIVDAAIDSLRAGRHHYSDVRGEHELRQAIARYHLQLTGQSVNADDCTVYAGAQNALFAVAQVLLESGDEAILSEPFYSTYRATFGATGAHLISLPVHRDNHYQLDTDAIVDAITARTRAIILNTPNNPLGTCYSIEQLEVIADACVANDIWLVLDTVYADIVDVKSLALPHRLSAIEHNLITVGSLSKSHRMTGWRIGWAIGPAPLATHLGNLSMCMHYGLPPFIMDAAIAALRDAADTPRTVQQHIAHRRQLVHQHLHPLGKIVLHDSGQGMFVILDVTDLGITAREFALGLLEHCAVAVLPCDGFGPAGRTLIRLGLCVDDEQLVVACQRIVSFIAMRA